MFSLIPRAAAGWLLGGLGVVIFGLTLPVTRIAVQSLDPWFVTLGRAAAAGLLALSVVVVLRRRPPPMRLWAAYLLAALCLVLGFPGFVALAMLTVPAGQGGVVLGVLPLATALAAVALGRERARPAFWLWSAAGAAVVVVFVLQRHGGHVGPGHGYLAGAVLATALGYAVSAELSRHRPGWEVISWQVILMLPLTLPLAMLLRPDAPMLVSREAWLAFGYVAVMSQYVGFFAWNAGLALGGTARISQVQLLQVFVTLAASAVLLGEPIEGTALLAAALVITFVVLSARARQATPRA